MILTAIKPVNARLGMPSTNAPNPRFLLPGDKVSIKSRVLGDEVFGNNEWVFTDENEFFSAEGFQITDELKSVPFLGHLQNIPQLFKDLEISAFWNVSRGEKIRIGIIDDGVSRHSLLRNKVIGLNEKPLIADSNNHGTTMACIIAALDETKGRIGIAPMVENIFSYKIDIESVGPRELIDALEQMEKAGVHVINMSFSSNKLSFFPPEEAAMNLQKKISDLADDGCVIISATGNESSHNNDIFYYPAKYDNVISVTGMNSTGNLDFTSNYWNGVNVSVPSSHYFDNHENDGLFIHSNATSGATAILSGCIACIYNLITGKNKASIIKNALSSLEPLKAVSGEGSETTVPKFDTKKFLHQLNIKL